MTYSAVELSESPFVLQWASVCGQVAYQDLECSLFFPSLLVSTLLSFSLNFIINDNLNKRYSYLVWRSVLSNSTMPTSDYNKTTLAFSQGTIVLDPLHFPYTLPHISVLHISGGLERLQIEFSDFGK